jgi:hypothetical protein
MTRRLFVNLTPLLDLLLLVIFAAQIRSSVVVREAVVTARNESDIRRDTEDSARRLAEKNETLLQEVEDLRAKHLTFREHARRLASSLHAAVQRIPEEDFFRTLSGASREEIRAIQETVDRSSGEDLLRRLARVESYNRHVTSWMLHLKEETVLEIRVNDGPPRRVVLGTNEAELRNRISKALAELEEPKDLVLLFFSWGRLLKSQKDRVDDVLDLLTRDTLRIKYPNKRCHLAREGYRLE